jgi:hypothetical protein
MKTVIFAFLGLFAAVSTAACSGAPSGDGSSSDTSDELRSTGECGGFVAHPKTCRAGYECIANKNNPDAPGHCEKMTYCVIDCAVGTHFVQENGECKCVPDDPAPTCATITCRAGYYCCSGVSTGAPDHCIPGNEMCPL